LSTWQPLKSRQRYKELAAKLEKLNERAIVAHWNHLRDIQTVLAIAGGQLKLNVIWILLLVGALTPEQRIITDLATDIGSAKKLIEAFKRLKTEPGMEDWYREIIKDIQLFC
jgi:hypothetical protein